MNDDDDELRIRRLEDQLEDVYEELRNTNGELRSTGEELQSAIGELETMNRFLTAVLAGMSSGLAVVDADLRVLAWNSRAEELWGVRSADAVGAQLADLGIGLPVEQLSRPIRARLTNADDAASVQVLDAVDLRGDPLRVQVTLTNLRDDGRDVPVAMLVMDVVGAAG